MGRYYKTIILAALILFCSGLAFAGNAAFVQMLSESGGSASGCPAYYADANVTFSWDGDHPSGTKYGCKADGSTILGTGSLTPNTSYGESGSYGVSLDGTNYLMWATSGDAQIDNEISTVYIRLKWSVDPTAIVTVFEGNESGDTTDSLYFAKETLANRFRGRWAGTVTVSASNVTEDAFTNAGYAWDRANDDQAAWDDSWEEDLNDGIVGIVLADFDEIVIGEKNFPNGAPDGGGYIYVDRIVIMSGYKTALPTNW